VFCKWSVLHAARKLNYFAEQKNVDTTGEAWKRENRSKVSGIFLKNTSKFCLKIREEDWKEGKQVKYFRNFLSEHIFHLPERRSHVNIFNTSGFARSEITWLLVGLLSKFSVYFSVIRGLTNIRFHCLHFQCFDLV